MLIHSWDSIRLLVVLFLFFLSFSRSRSDPSFRDPILPLFGINEMFSFSFLFFWCSNCCCCSWPIFPLPPIHFVSCHYITPSFSLLSILGSHQWETRCCSSPLIVWHSLVVCFKCLLWRMKMIVVTVYPFRSLLNVFLFLLPHDQMRKDSKTSQIIRNLLHFAPIIWNHFIWPRRLVLFYDNCVQGEHGRILIF